MQSQTFFLLQALPDILAGWLQRLHIKYADYGTAVNLVSFLPLMAGFARKMKK